MLFVTRSVQPRWYSVYPIFQVLNKCYLGWHAPAQGYLILLLALVSAIRREPHAGSLRRLLLKNIYAIVHHARIPLQKKSIAYRNRQPNLIIAVLSWNSCTEVYHTSIKQLQ